MPFYEPRILGRTKLSVGRLGVACSYGAPTEAFEEAFERGVNYFYWGSTRKKAMAQAIRHIVSQGRRDNLVIVLQSYSRSAVLLESFFRQGLRTLGVDYADVLLLGWHNQPPSPRIMDRVRTMRHQGLFRYLAISGHHRPLFPVLAPQPEYDIFHVRYNAVHRGAEQEVFPQMPVVNRPGLVTYTATRWGDLLNPKKMPSGEDPPRGADCYRFVLSQPDVDVCLTGPRTRAEMQEALKALDLGPLSETELARMRRLGDHLHTHYRRVWGN